MPKNKNGNWTCSRMGCGKPANYHVAGEKIHLYYCHEHWSIRLGHAKEKVHKKKTKNKSD